MRRSALTLMVFLLTGCVTIHQNPPTAPATPVQPATPQVVQVCIPYKPPLRRRIPPVPDIGEPKGDYTAYLEGAAEQLVDHITALRLYIAAAHQDQDDALREHERSCKQ